MKLRHIAAALLIFAGCDRKNVTVTAPVVKAALPLPNQFDGAWVMSSGWSGYMGVALAVSKDRYYYWMYSDVFLDGNYPYTGKFRIEGGELILGEPSELETGKHVKEAAKAGLYSDRWRILRKDLSVRLHSVTDAPEDHARTLLPDFQFDPSEPFQNQLKLMPEVAPSDDAKPSK